MTQVTDHPRTSFLPVTSSRKRRALGAGLVLAATPLLLLPPAQALSQARISFSGTTANSSPGNCDSANLNYRVNVTPSHNDGGGDDWYVVTTIDGSNTPVDVDYRSAPVSAGSTSYTDYTDFGSINSLATRPASISVYDVPVDPSTVNSNENTTAAYNWTRRHGKLLATDTMDPANVDAYCSSLPVSKATPVTRTSLSPRVVHPSTRAVVTTRVSVPLRQVPSGTVKIQVAGHTLTAYIDNSGSAKFRLPRLSAGSKTLTMTYSGDAWTHSRQQTVRFTVRR